MRIALMAVLVFIALVLQSIPVAAEISSYSVDVIISDDTASSNIEMIFTKPVKNLIMSIPGTPQDVNVEPTCRIDKALLQTNIICDDVINKLIVTYKSSIHRKEGWLIWSETFRMPQPASNLSVRVKLPAGAALKEPVTDAIEPSGASITSDGRHIQISWSASNVKEQWTGSIAYERFEISAISTLLAIIAIIVAAGAIAYKYYFTSSKEGMKMILPVLKKDEKTILECLIKHGSGVNQKIIVKESGYSKAKVSKVLKSLSERGLVKLERTGRSNRIFWGKEIKKES
ncbi:MAG: helix-turn-helix domain-containing protein [Candidatus Aenigmatarchaeota archaeon]|nr:helix-turn-helix domain-containing protein [Candidatus Aenigmarchaeota archaeon]